VDRLLVQAINNIGNDRHAEAETNLLDALKLKELLTPGTLISAANLFFEMKNFNKLNEILLKMQAICPHVKLQGYSLYHFPKIKP
jgi:uncharacterized membrane-anchored protein